MLKKLQKKVFKHKRLLAVCALAIMMVSSFACATDGTEAAPSLTIDFDIATMFTWAQTMISAMLPVVYITMGVSLGFIIIRAFKSAFN